MAEKKTAPAEAPAGVLRPDTDYKPMNLHQKFVELRKAVPQIVKKQHSDGVKYTFAKIFDVYELLAPAMNLVGVDWDIVKEIPTRHAENGDAVYYTSFDQNTRNGVRVVWVYEADLVLRWINVDKPEETEEITLHALGTNDGGPDKAKGSAWTYCLKYYLFEKFNIDQGEDDPDNYDHSSDALPNGQNGPQNAGNGGSRGNGRQQPQGAQNGSQKPGTLSEAQINRMYKKAEACGMTTEACNRRIKEKYGHDTPAQLTRQQYDEICASLDAAAQKKAQEQGGQENAQ